MRTLTVSAPLSRDNIIDVLFTAIYRGGTWLDEAEEITIGHDHVRFKLNFDGEMRDYSAGPDEIQRALQRALDSGNEALRAAVCSGADAWGLDGELADTILQLAVFNERVFN